MPLGRSRLLILTIGATAILAIILFAVVRVLTPPPNVTLTDGNLVTLAGVTTGPTHSLTTGLPWDKTLGWLPRDLRQFFPRGNNHYDAPKHKAPLGIWFRFAKEIPHESYVTVSGEDGIEVFSTGRTSYTDANITFHAFSSLPTTSKRLTVAILLRQDPDTFIRAGALHFDNPFFEQSTDSSPSLPQTISSSGLTVTLHTLQVAPYRVGKQYKDLTHCCRARARFDIVEQGDTRKRWRPCKAKLLDLHGNPVPSGGSTAGPPTRPFISFDPYASPDKPWKLLVDFEKAIDFDPTELMTFENIPLSRDTKELDVAATQKASGTDLSLTRLTVNPSRPGEIQVHLRLSKTTPNTRVTLVSSKTDISENISRGGSRVFGEEWIFDLWNTSSEAKTMTLTFAVHQSHTFEFLAQPSIVNALKD